MSTVESPLATKAHQGAKPQEGTSDVSKADLEALFAEERPGWTGYVEWEQYPDKKEMATKILVTKKFTPIPEFQFVPLPNTNPVLIGHRWKEYHEVLGLKSIVDFSWETVQKEKHDLIHILDFPYNGETRRPQLLEGKITSNEYHFVRNHGGVPNIKEDEFELEIGGLVKTPVKLSMKDLKDPSKFPSVFFVPSHKAYSIQHPTGKSR
ncbi:hypothetical protein E1B28_012074 [Marasmius oreades]|uniref:Uncharacterized protein n=1 Tax=Marasmius oreades TaxID=181124 RepID=A0A9P7UNJ9_9AGAR|nr:uncharacterized protein E1B28_012074 [Marasmius oreades]KAG7088040.1 hypothetical protein E1B28_012074 [Marasmius oreades]